MFFFFGGGGGGRKAMTSGEQAFRTECVHAELLSL